MTGEENRPHAEDPAKPDSVTDIQGPTWKHVLKRTAFESVDDQITDIAAALTYFAVLSIFPALIALVSILGLVGRAESTVDRLIDIMGSFVPADAMRQLEPIVANLMDQQGAGLGLVLGLATALWTASNYVAAFARGMNRIYEIEEGRPIWKLRPLLYGLTAVILTLIAFAGLLLVVSGPVAEAVGAAIGLGATALTAWNVLKWPALLVVTVLLIGVLYYWTPNVRQPRFRWISVGAIIAIVVAVIASFGFSLYISNFGSYRGTYGALAGVIVFLFWLWIMNLALLLGAETDAELERGRQLQAGIRAEEDIQLPARDERNIRKKGQREEDLVDGARALRESHGTNGSAGDDVSGLR